jgi:hypothetical protein
VFVAVRKEHKQKQKNYKNKIKNPNKKGWYPLRQGLNFFYNGRERESL